VTGMASAFSMIVVDLVRYVAKIHHDHEARCFAG
jgi:hypothetical protein